MHSAPYFSIVGPTHNTGGLIITLAITNTSYKQKTLIKLKNTKIYTKSKSFVCN